MKRPVVDEDFLLGVLALLGVVLLIALPVIVWTQAPCGLWTFASMGDTPARCFR